MKITIILRNEDQTHEEVDNLAGLIENVLEEGGYKNVATQEFSTEYHVTAETADDEEEDEEEAA